MVSIMFLNYFVLAYIGSAQALEEKNLNTNAVETKAINMESDDDNQNNKKKKSEEAQRAMKEMIEKL